MYEITKKKDVSTRYKNIKNSHYVYNKILETTEYLNYL